MPPDPSRFQPPLAALLRGLVAILLLWGGLVLQGAPLRSVRLQLKWYHQFQFAGFYAAQLKGYYREAGLEVTLLEASPTHLPLPSVLGGRAEFGVSDAEVFQAYLEGTPLVALGAIFQHSPNVILAVRGRGIEDPADLAGKTAMFQGGQGAVEARAMLAAEGIRLDTLRIVPHTWRLQDLVEGKVDALSAYSTNEPYALAALGVDLIQLRPIAYGVDFYGDLLFTTRAFAEGAPEVTEAFRVASFRGWEYAMAHPEELIAHILTLPGVRERGITANKLRFEADHMKELLLPGLVGAGHMNPGRFQAMASAMATHGGVTVRVPPEGFILEPPVPRGDAFLRVARLVGPWFLGAALLVAVWITHLRRTVHLRTRALQGEVERRAASEEALRQSERRLAQVLDSVDAYIFFKDREGRYTYVNRKVAELFGRDVEDILGQRDDAFFAGEPLAAIEADDHRVLALGETLAREEVGLGQTPDGPTTHWTVKLPLRDEAGTIYALCGHATDITAQRRHEAERQRFEARLHHAQKMESLGSLAGGIAHDMNNVLGAILGLASAHQSQLPPESPLHRALDTIVKASERGGDLVRGLLHFARQTPSTSQRVDLNALAREEVRLLERTTLARVQIELELEAGLPEVLGDASALASALMNLCVNAVDAMPDGGTLRLCTRERGSGLVELAVEDTGCGMTPEVLAKAMDPFFTTKEQGRGTGLGLALVYTTVKAHGGEVQLHSEPHRGTRVTMLLPAAPAEAAAATPDIAEPGEPLRALRVLVVDDDPLVRQSVEVMLETLGHDPTLVASGEAALERLQEGALPDVVILDLNMPGLGGAQTLRNLRKRHPHLPVLLATGRADQSALDLLAGDSATRLLPKPYTLADLRQALPG